MSEIILPKFMNIGGGKIKSVTDILKKINCDKPLIITDKTMVKLNIIEPFAVESPTFASVENIGRTTCPSLLLICSMLFNYLLRLIRFQFHSK